MPQALRARSPLIYRAALALPIGVIAFLLLTGRLTAYWRGLSPQNPASEEEVFYHFTTGLIWVAGFAPLVFLAWELGRQHTAARRLGYSGLIGIRELLRIAIHGPDSSPPTDAFVRPPHDNPRAAILLGFGAAALFPAFFLAAAPPLRTSNGVIWLAVAGILAGLAMYWRRRAAAYLIDEPTYWGFFRQWQLLNPNRYDPPGSRFVRRQIVATCLLPLWWLAGGAYLVILP